MEGVLTTAMGLGEVCMGLVEPPKSDENAWAQPVESLRSPDLGDATDGRS